MRRALFQPLWSFGRPPGFLPVNPSHPDSTARPRPPASLQGDHGGDGFIQVSPESVPPRGKGIAGLPGPRGSAAVPSSTPPFQA